jgi:IMP cyclohydrolase
MSVDLAVKNVRERIEENPYPGRGIVLGRSGDGAWVQVYWIMGRSDNSRNRIFVCEDGVVRTEAADPSKVEDPSLIIYNAMRASGHRFVVSNGVQTDAIWAALEASESFVDSLSQWHHEPDAPNFTPRISGCTDVDAQVQWLSILKKSPFSDVASERHFFRFDEVEPGMGYAITTYCGDGDPLPSFEGTPYLLSLPGSADDIADHFWSKLNRDNRISLAVRRIESKSGELQIVIKNRYSQI